MVGRLGDKYLSGTGEEWWGIYHNLTDMEGQYFKLKLVIVEIFGVFVKNYKYTVFSVDLFLARVEKTL